jgi:hypothetical protein
VIVAVVAIGSGRSLLGQDSGKRDTFRRHLEGKLMGWHHNDLTAATGAPLTVNSAAPKGYVFEAQRTQHVIYLGPIDIPGQGTIRGRIHELWWDWNAWHHTSS